MSWEGVNMLEGFLFIYLFIFHFIYLPIKGVR